MARTSFMYFVCVILCTWISAEERNAPNPAPLWSADLRQFSYSSRTNPRYIGGKSYFGGKRQDSGVLFRTTGEVICYFVTKEVGTLTRRGEFSGAFQLQIVEFDADSGSLKFRRELPTQSTASLILVNRERNLIIRTGELLRLYAADFAVLKEYHLPRQSEFDEWNIQLSTTRKTLLLDHYAPFASRAEVLDSSSFAVLTSWRDGQLVPAFSTSDRAVAIPNPRETGILLRSFHGEWEAVPNGSRLACVWNPVFVSEVELVNACGHEILLLTTTGEVIMRDTLGKKENFEQLVVASQDGRFIAVSAMETKGGFLDYTNIKRSRTRVLVYDIGLRKQVFSLRLDSIPQNDYEFALSPDGTKLVVISDHALQVYGVPR